MIELALAEQAMRVRDERELQTFAVLQGATAVAVEFSVKLK